MNVLRGGQTCGDPGPPENRHLTPVPLSSGNPNMVRWLRSGLTDAAKTKMFCAVALVGGALVSTWNMRQRRHAEDDAFASLIIASNKTANEELALAA